MPSPFQETITTEVKVGKHVHPLVHVKKTGEHADREHALYSPSSSKQWLLCPASATEAAKCKRADTAASLRGTRLHEVCEARLLHGTIPADPEEAEFAQGWIDALTPILDAHPKAKLYQEIRVYAAGHLNDGTSIVHGSLDLGIYDPQTHDLWVLDIKSGYQPVQAQGNSQLLIYAAGLTRRVSGPVEIVHLGIYQPGNPAGDYHDDDATPAEVHALVSRIEQVVTDPMACATYNPGPACDISSNCHATCPHRQRALVDAFDAVEVDVTRLPVEQVRPALPAPASLTAEQLSRVLLAASTLEKWLAAVEAEAIARAKEGKTIPGYAWVNAPGRTKWDGDEKDILAQLKALGYAPREKLPTISEVKKTFGAGADALLELFTVRPEGKALKPLASVQTDALFPDA